ncbi:MAG TPA: acetyl ornithine aminotransferase family protein [Candidatus Thermoplasmatota archaeon]|nr:acetyl ornithine aminotransferase family protein [Candidatus Thermoplasmatota archaeon]
MRRPLIKTPPPGPAAKAIVARDTAALMTTTKTAPVVAERAEGVWIEDVDGNRFLDFTSGVGVVNTGYANPRVVEAIQRQAAKLIHYAGTDYYYREQVELAERLAKVTPGAFAKKVFFSNSGTESNEAAIKIARYHKRRPQFIAFVGAFHGRSMGSLSLTASKIVHKQRFFPTMPGVTHVPYANPYRNPWGIDGYADGAELVNRVIDHVENLFSTMLPAEEIAALFVEPVQGEGGYVVPPKQFLPALRKLCDAHGILLAADEVQSGFGRTGKMFAQDHFGVASDLLSLAKGIASGVPMGAQVARADLDFDVSGAHSNTFGGNALAAAAALATLDCLEKDGLVENAAKQGKRLREGLDALKAKHDAIGDVRGLGLMLATDFVKDRASREPDAKLRDRVADEAFRRGLVLLPCGKSSLRYIPPLVVSAEEIDAGLEVLREAITAALK